MALIIFTKHVNLCNIVEYKNSLYRTYLQLWYMENVDNNREVKHDVNGRRQTAKITSDFEFFSSNP